MRANASAKGSYSVELALTIGVIFLLILAFTDFARFLTARVIAVYAAQEALGLAQRLPEIDLDLRGICSGTSSPQECSLYESSRLKVQARARDRATRSFLKDSSLRGSVPQALVPIRYTSYVAATATTTADAILLRPGETANRDRERRVCAWCSGAEKSRSRCYRTDRSVGRYSQAVPAHHVCLL